MIRAANNGDLDLILELSNHAILHTNAIYEEEPWILETVKTWFDKRTADGFPVFVFVENEKPVGYASYGKFRDRFGYRFTVEHSVYVLSDFQGKGIGAQLLNHIISDAESAGYKQMIGVVDATNEQSIQFHKQLGFVKAGTLSNVGNKFGKWLSIALLQKKTIT